MIMIKINVELEEEKKDTTYRMSENTADILRFLEDNKDYAYTRDEISRALDINYRTVSGSLVGLQKLHFVTKEDRFYQFIPQNEEIKYKYEYHKSNDFWSDFFKSLFS